MDKVSDKPTTLELMHVAAEIKNNEIDTLTQELAAAKAEVEQLTAAIEAAPHDRECEARVIKIGRMSGDEELCNCWKANAPQPDKP